MTFVIRFHPLRYIVVTVRLVFFVCLFMKSLHLRVPLLRDLDSSSIWEYRFLRQNRLTMSNWLTVAWKLYNDWVNQLSLFEINFSEILDEFELFVFNISMPQAHLPTNKLNSKSLIPLPYVSDLYLLRTFRLYTNLHTKQEKDRSKRCDRVPFDPV